MLCFVHVLTHVFCSRYAAPLYLDVKQRRLVESDEIDLLTGDKRWVDEDDNNVIEAQKVFIGKVRAICWTVQRVKGR